MKMTGTGMSAQRDGKMSVLCCLYDFVGALYKKKWKTRFKSLGLKTNSNLSSKSEQQKQ